MTFEEYANMLKEYSIIEVNLTNDLNKNLEKEEKMELKTLIKTIKDLNSVISDILKSEKSEDEKLDRIKAINEVIILLLKNPIV